MNFSQWMKLGKPYNSLVNIDNIIGCSNLGNDKIDLIITSPPYNVSINYDTYEDTLHEVDYYLLVEKWMESFYNVLKPNRNYLGFELSKKYADISEYRIQEYDNKENS